ncbi:MAG: aminoacyl-tRNA hydrolase [Nocardioidaceae bacterium]
MPDDAPSAPWLVVGLGNPGPSYARTRHNVGQMVLDVLAVRQQASWRRDRSGRADVVEGRVGGIPGVRVVLAKPRSYMNESGGPVATLMRFHKASPERLVVVHDEIDLPYATLRIKRGGGDNGHNGLRSLRQSLATGEFCRVRIGVGRPPGRQDPADFVLAPFAAAQRTELGVHLETAADAVESLVTSGLIDTQSRYNG